MTEWSRRTGYPMADSIGYRDGETYTPLCYQKRLRDQYEVDSRLGLEDWEIKEIPFREAQSFILQFEWLGTMGTTQFSYGLYLDGVLSGVLCFGLTAGTGALSEPFGEEYKSKGIVLVRGACAPWAHEHAASFFIGRVLPLVEARGYRFVIAYSDPEAGEIGTVYQATNWEFYGFTSPVRYLIRPDGKRVDPKIVHKYAKKNFRTTKEQKAVFEAEGYTWATGSRKLKYLIKLGSKRERKELTAAQRVQTYPYLKRCEDMREVYNEWKKAK